MKVYELVESCNEPYESWDHGIALYKSKEMADAEAEAMNVKSPYDSCYISYSVVERDLI